MVLVVGSTELDGTALVVDSTVDTAESEGRFVSVVEVDCPCGPEVPVPRESSSLHAPASTDATTAAATATLRLDR
jgi:hypothetical protein